MASGYAKHTGKLGVCLATTGPGAVHLMNGLYDAKMDSAPVLAITGTTFHDLIGTHFMQSVDTVSLMSDVALYNVQVSGPLNARIVGNIACRAALDGRGVAHLTVAKDTQNMPAVGGQAVHGKSRRCRPRPRGAAPIRLPSADRLQSAADILNSGTKVAVLVGQGALGARDEVTQLCRAAGRARREGAVG